MRYLGIDYGEKRVGIAVSDSGGRLAFPKKMILNLGSEKLARRLMLVIKKEGISKIIVGLPLGSHRQKTDQTRKVINFVDGLKKKTPLPIEFEDELLTTRIVEKSGVKKERADSSAAAIILQSYLDKLKA